MDKMFKIYCQDVDRPRMVEVLSQTFDSFTILPAMGWYKGQREKAVVIEVWGTTKSAVTRVCKDLAAELKQEMVAFVEVHADISEVFGVQSPIPELLA